MTDDRAFDVKRLAEKWGCSTDAIYDMIDHGVVRTFAIGKPDKKGKRKGLRISAKEVERCENGSEHQSTAQATAPSGGAAKRQWPSSAIRALAGAKG